MRARIFIDFDDTVVQTRPLAAAFLRKHYGAHIPMGQEYNGDNLFALVSQHLPPDAQMSEKDFWLHYSHEHLASHEWHRSAEPTLGATDIIPRLAKHYELWTVTARPTLSREVVHTVLERLFPNCFTDSHFVWHFDGTEFVGTPKHTFMELMGSGVAFVDDSPHEIARAQHVVESFLFDPHNHHEQNQQITNRVTSWYDIADRFL